MVHKKIKPRYMPRVSCVGYFGRESFRIVICPLTSLLKRRLY